MSTKKFVARHGIDTNQNTISNVADPVNQQDAATKKITDNISNDVIIVNDKANSAFDQANTALSTAQSAYDQANNALLAANNSSLAVIAYDQANSAQEKANTKVYTFYQSIVPTSANSRDFWTNSNTGIVYENFGTTSNPIWAEFGPTGTIQINGLNDVSNAFNQANTATTIAQSAYGQANTATTNAGNAFNQANTATTNAGNAFNQANIAFNTANGKFSNSGGIITGNTTINDQLSISYLPNSTQNTAISIIAANTKGGIGYADFLSVKNDSSGSKSNLYFRLHNSGSLEIVDSSYSNTLITLTQSGILHFNTQSQSPSNQIPNKYAVSFNNGHSYIFDDGNFHITSNTGNIWINSNNGGDVVINDQSPANGGLKCNGTFQMNSGYGYPAPVYGVRAWIVCGWNGSSMVTYSSGNLSVSRSSTGIYVFTFGTNMPDENYCVSATALTPTTNSDVAANIHNGTSPSSSSFTIATARYGDGFKDVTRLCVQVVR